MKSLLAPNRRRWIILGMVFVVMVLNYVDRQIVAILKPTIKDVFSIDDRGFAWLLNVFLICYASSYAIAGWLVDRFGAGRMMLLGVITWSTSCLVAAFTRTFGQLAFCRALLGISEPTSFPSQLRVVTIWFPPRLRATANSICAAGSTIGAIIAVPSVAFIAHHFDWHMAFVVPGVIGLVLALLWFLIYREPPKAEEAVAADVPKESETKFTWTQLWRTRSLWGILLCRFISEPVWYFCLFWLPGYLQEETGLSLVALGAVGWIPFLAADIGGVGSSIFSDRLVRRGVEPLRARKLTLTGAAALAPIVILTPHLPHLAATLVIFSVVGAMCLTWLFNMGVVVAETFPSANVGSVWGIAGAFGVGGAAIFNLFVGDAMASYGAAKIFLVMGSMHPVATIVLWKMVRNEKSRATVRA